MIKLWVLHYNCLSGNIHEPWTRVNDAWMVIPQDTIETLFDLILRRVQQVVQARVGRTIY